MTNATSGKQVGLQQGDLAPPFDVTASDGRRLKLEDFRGKQNVVLYFYPRDFTLVCTRETCGFRDAYEDLATKDTEIIGVSFDSDDSHAAFAKEHNVPFPLVADENKALATTYGAYGKGGGLLRGLIGGAKRITYVIDKNGVIAGVFASELRAGHHVDSVKALVDKLR